MNECCKTKGITVNREDKDFNGQILIFESFFCSKCFSLGSRLIFTTDKFHYMSLLITQQRANSQVY